MAALQSGTYGLEPSLVRYDAIATTFRLWFNGASRFLRSIPTVFSQAREVRELLDAAQDCKTTAPDVAAELTRRAERVSR